MTKGENTKTEYRPEYEIGGGNLQPEPANKNPLLSKLWLVISVAFASMGAILLILARIAPGFGDFYTENIYPIWQGSLGRLSGILPFSLSEVILYFIPLLLIWDIAANRKRISNVGKHLAVFLSILLFLYSANCGVNYYRSLFSEKEGIEITEGNSIALTSFCEDVARELNQISWEEPYPTGADLAKESVRAMEGLGATFPSLSGFYPRPKAIFVSRPFTNMEVTGIYSPFTIEANYNREIPSYDLPYTACHELSHLKGYMDEGEANFIGWLACLESDNEAFRRSAYMLAWVYGGNALIKENPEKHREIRSTLPKAALAEFKAANEFWRKYSTSAAEVQDKINDAYLKSNGIEAGVESYNQVLSLMLSWYQLKGEL